MDTLATVAVVLFSRLGFHRVCHAVLDRFVERSFARLAAEASDPTAVAESYRARVH